MPQSSTWKRADNVKVGKRWRGPEYAIAFLVCALTSDSDIWQSERER